MSAPGGPAAPRQFVAHPPFWGSKVAAKTTPLYSTPGKSVLMTVGAIAVVTVLLLGLRSCALSGHGGFAEDMPTYLLLGGLLIFFGVFGVVTLRRSRRGEIVIAVTSDHLTVSERPGDVYAFGDAQLGAWTMMGTALHLQCGPRRFVLGGRDHRVGAATALDAPDVGYGLKMDVDAWLWTTEFAEVLAAVGRRSGLQVHPPAPGEPLRCLLYPNPLLRQKIGSFAFRKQWQAYDASSRPSRVIEVGGDAIRVIDPHGAVMASVSPAQVSATPAIYRPASRHLFPTAGHVASDSLYNALSTEPEMVVAIPGLQPLTIGCRDYVGAELRFSWRGEVAMRGEPAAYSVTGADWLTLVKVFGLASHLNRREQQG